MGHNNQITIKDILSKHDNMYDVSYMFTQPITLIFDGETLKIYENGLELEEYDARSGKVEKRKEIPAKSVNTEDNQTLDTVANEEDNKTQAEEKNNLNLVDNKDSIKKVAYPGVSACKTLAQDYNGKYYYYDDKNTTKIPEGEYYILFDEPSKSSSTDNADTQSNEIIVGEPSKYQDKLGERYIEIYKSSELLFNNEDSFNQSIYNRKAETKENFDWFGNKTSYLIHGGTDYEDENGIDLSSAINTFCSDLSDKIINNYNNGNLYTTYGKVPIKLNVKYSRDWHDPLDKMEIALFNTGLYRPSHGAFGYMRDEGKKKHTGLDLFALDGTPVYACMDGVIQYNNSDKNFGYRIFLEINTKEGLEIYRNRIKERNYTLLYPKLKEMTYGNGYKENGNVYSFSYCHLQEFDHKLIGTTKEVKAGDIIGYTGSSGNARGSDSPHLHIEVRSMGAGPLGGLGQKINPAYFFDFKYPSNEIAPCNTWSDHKFINDFFSDKNLYKEYIKIHFKEQYDYVAKKYNKKDI